ncbi:MAG: hypothetical protein ACXAC7_17990 [Candidatus Hodarchaeales archaeon]|jgi:hypothetical protein
MSTKNQQSFGISFVTFSKNGLTPITSTKLPFIAESQIETFLLRFSTPLGMMIGQGDQFFTGLYGPFPIANYSDWVALTYSFFLLDVDIGTPRDDANLYTIIILFIPRSYHIPFDLLTEIFKEFVKGLKNVNSLLDISIIDNFCKAISENLLLKIEEIDSKEKQSKLITPVKEPLHEELKMDYDGESLLAVPWILHAVHHGLERAGADIMGGSSNLIDRLADQYTGEILDKFHLLDRLSIDQKNDVIKAAINLGVEHLERVGEKVELTALSENKFKIVVKCDFTDAVHPYLPIAKCLWIKYIVAIVRTVLPANKEIYINDSEFDDLGSITILEIKRKPFQTLKGNI